MPIIDIPTSFDTFTLSNGDYYEGYAFDHIPHGEGTMYYMDSNKERSGYWLFGYPVSNSEPVKKIPGFSQPEYQSVITLNKHSICVGYGYDNNSIAEIFGVSKFHRGIRIHRNVAVLISLNNTVYKDGDGWEKDSDGEYVFYYTGEGLEGDQEMSKGNYFLANSKNGNIFLFVKRRSNDYIFYGETDVKRIEEATEADVNGKPRKVFKFVLRRHPVE